MSKGLWMLKDSGALTSGEITFDNISRINVKRPQQRFMNGNEAEHIPMKKQALVDPKSSLLAGVPPSGVPWGDMSGFDSIPTQLNEKMLNTVTTRNINSDARNDPCNDGRYLITVRDPSEITSSYGLSMSHRPTNSMFGIDHGITKKVNANENFMPISIGPSHSREVGVEAATHGFSRMDNSSVSTFLSYGREDANAMKSGELYGIEDDNCSSMRQLFSKGDGAEIVIGHKNVAGYNFMPMPMSFSKNNPNFTSTPGNLCKGDYSVISSENQSNEGDSMNSMRQVYKGDSCVSASNDDGTSARMIGSYNLQLGIIAGERTDKSSPKDLIVTNAILASSTAEALSAGAESSSKKDSKLSKEIPLNIFPSNVRSLLSTHILDEVPVKYTAWSREKVLPGIIKGTGYLCGCQSCNFSKVINAYEFERHAGCKTKHPNNHIYFDNGKTIYGVVQELRSTPQHMLFDVIQTVTSSLINQKAFRLWKESFLAATRELQRIYSKDERKQLL